MKSTVELDELTERIRSAAARENKLAASPLQEHAAKSRLGLPPLPAVPVMGATDSARPEILLAEAAAMLKGGRRKNAVPLGVPKWLRPFFRNQGGVNALLLEAVERLVEVNASLRRQNSELQERMTQFHAWASAVAEASAENRPALSADEPGAVPPEASQAAALQPIEAQLALQADAIETLKRSFNDHFNRLDAHVREQDQHIHTVHHHLDQLGAHVDAGLARLT